MKWRMENSGFYVRTLPGGRGHAAVSYRPTKYSGRRPWIGGIDEFDGWEPRQGRWTTAGRAMNAIDAALRRVRV